MRSVISHYDSQSKAGKGASIQTVDHVNLIASLVVCSGVVLGQQTPPADPAPSPEAKRLLWIVPNYRTSPSIKDFEPITPKEKFKIASEDAFDRGTIGLAAIFAGIGQVSNSNPSFGQGGAGFGRYFGTAYADLAIGDYMTEGVFPTLFHQDPRYFRKGSGSGRSRLGYAMGQIFWTHTDHGTGQFNYSEFLGNSAATAIGIAYYPDNRTASSAVSRLGSQIAIDMTSNVLKEFWPEISRKPQGSIGPIKRMGIEGHGRPKAYSTFGHKMRWPIPQSFSRGEDAQVGWCVHLACQTR